MMAKKKSYLETSFNVIPECLVVIRLPCWKIKHDTDDKPTLGMTEMDWSWVWFLSEPKRFLDFSLKL